MHNIDEDNITQAVIARHATAADARVRELMTSLVQHLHAFAREVKLSEKEWQGGLRFLAECGRTVRSQRDELLLLSDALGLSMLVAAQNHRKPRGCTEATPAGPLAVEGTHAGGRGATPGEGFHGPACFIRGTVRSAGGTPIAGAHVQIGHAADEGLAGVPSAGGAGPDTGAHALSAADGTFHFRWALAQPQPIPHDGPVGRLLAALGRHPWRPAHLPFMISAPGYERLVTHVFRAEDRYLDSDAVFGVRGSLVAPWVQHGPGRTPDGRDTAQPFYTLDFDFVLNPTTGDPP